MPSEPTEGLDALLARLARGPDPLCGTWAQALLNGERAVPEPTTSARLAEVEAEPAGSGTK
jgi:hypothetical protein